MVESECYLFGLIGKLEVIFVDCGLGDMLIIVCMSGCLNGCLCFYIVEIGFFGCGLGIYNFYLGGGFYGQ